MNIFQDLGAVALMMAATEDYKKWTVDELCGYILPPMSLGFYHIFNRGTDSPVFVSYGFLNQEAATRYVLAKGSARRLSVADLQSGEEPWILDFIAPNGGIRPAIKALHKIYPGVCAKHIRRKDGEVRGRLGRRFKNVA